LAICNRLQGMGEGVVRFFVAAALVGSPTDAIQRALPDLLEELEARAYLDEPRVSWDADARQAIVELQYDAQTARQAGGAVHDEVFESAVAVIPEFERIRVEILEVRPDQPA
jgi:hypothetical protein